MDEAKKLGTRVDEIDETIRQKEELLTMKGATMDSPLVDDEGYPIAELDHYTIRELRHEINCLQNDRKALVKQMEEVLAQLHQSNTSSQQGGVSPMETDAPPSTATVHRTSNDPIARIDAVAEGSPAAKAGVHANDLVIQFDTLHAGNFTGLHQLRGVVELGKPIHLTVFRKSSMPHVHRLELIPVRKSEGGPFVLGCQFTTATDSKE